MRRYRKHILITGMVVIAVGGCATQPPASSREGRATSSASAPAARQASPPAAVAVSVTGTAQKLDPGTSVWQPLKPGDVLHEQASVRTGLMSEVVLKILDGGDVILSSSTKIKITELQQGRSGVRARLELTYGSARKIIDPNNKPVDLEVQSQPATMTIIGPSIDTAYDLHLLRGCVARKTRAASLPPHSRVALRRREQ